MNIIIPNLPMTTIHDIAQCLESVKEQSNIQPLFWNATHKSIIDLFDETRPDIIFLHQSQLDAGWKFVCNEFQFKYILIVDDPNQREPIDNLSHKPSAIITHPQMSHLFKEYQTINIQAVAKVVQIHNAKHEKNMESEVLVDTTNVTIDQNINNILLYLTNNYRTKIIGDNTVSFHQYLGKVTIFERANFIKSAKVVIDLEANPSRCWDAAYLKVPSITLYPVEDPISQFNNLQELRSNIKTICDKDIVRKKYIDQCYEKVYNNKTSYHFTAQIFNKIDENYIAENLLKYLEGLKT